MSFISKKWQASYFSWSFSWL